MPDEALEPALRAALRMHEIGSGTPYRLYFAAKGKSGASFGYMQGDLAANQPVVRSTFTEILEAQGFSSARVKMLLKALSVHLISNPLSKQDTDDINAALEREARRVDGMDEAILAKVYSGLDACSKAAERGGRTIEPKAQIGMALWINMSGPPTKLLVWLAGGEPHLSRPVPSPGALVTELQIEAYLRATSYYSENPGNFPHFLASVKAGAALLGGAANTALKLAVWTGSSGEGQDPLSTPVPYTLASISQDHIVYEQSTGRLLNYEGGSYDTLAVGYSGSLSRHAKNDPDQQCVKNAGPIPRGSYTIGSPRKGPSPYSLPLEPDRSNDMCGRSGFLIHGDSISHPGDASDGCIILTRAEREAVVATGQSTLVVVDRVSA